MLCARSHRRLLIIASLLLAVICSSAVYLYQRSQTRWLETRQTTAEERNTLGGSITDIPTQFTARVPSASTVEGTPAFTTPASTKLVGVWSKLNTSALSQVPLDPQCSDSVCSDFAPNSICAAKVARFGPPVTPTCRFQNGTSKPKYLLRSFPGSGNTWVRQVLEKVTGICTGVGHTMYVANMCSYTAYTGSVYCDYEIWRSGMIGEGLDTRSVLVVKAHSIKVNALTDTLSTVSRSHYPVYVKWQQLCACNTEKLHLYTVGLFCCTSVCHPFVSELHFTGCEHLATRIPWGSFRVQ